MNHASLADFALLVIAPVGFLLSVCVYLTPSLIAALRSHPRRWPVFLVNLFLGWVLGWVAALVWALKRSAETSSSPSSIVGSAAESNERVGEDLARIRMVDNPDWHRLAPAIVKAWVAILLVLGTAWMFLYLGFDAFADPVVEQPMAGR